MRQARWALQLDDAAAQALRDRFGSTGCLKLGEQRLEVELHCVHRDTERTCHGLVAHALTDEGEDLRLARCEQWRCIVIGGAEAVTRITARRTHQQSGG